MRNLIVSQTPTFVYLFIYLFIYLFYHYPIIIDWIAM